MKKIKGYSALLLSLILIFSSLTVGFADMGLTSAMKEESLLHVEKIAHYDSKVEGEGGTEIVAYDHKTQTTFSVNGAEKALDILDLSVLSEGASELSLVKRVSLDQLKETLTSVSDLTSVAVSPNSDWIAVAAPADPQHDPGHIVFMDMEGNVLNAVEVGALPDMVTVTPDGTKVVVANEGQPNADYTINPEGSISVIDVTGDIAALSADQVTTLSFADESIIDESVRKVYGGASYAQDLEPEYIAVDANSEMAYVVLQEANAIALVDLVNMSMVSVNDLGYKDHSIAGNELDASNKDDAVQIKSWPVLGMYQPDGITLFEQGGKTYLLTANEGDSADYEGFSEETRVSDIKDQYALNAKHYENVTQAQLDEMVANGLFEEEQLGRLKTTISAPMNEEGQYEAIYGYGARSFTIWDTSDMSVVYDSGSDFEMKTAEIIPAYFNATNDEDGADDRSDDKGPEPEAVVVGQVGDKTYSFIGLERVGGVMAYDVTNVKEAKFAGYFSSRNLDGEAFGGDTAPEGLTFVAAEHSPTGNALLLVAHEVSGTIAVYEMKQHMEEKEINGTKITILHTNDSHGRVEEGKYDGMGFAKIATLVEAYHMKNPNTLLLDAGDTLHGTSFATLEEGVSIVEVLNEVGYDGMAAGNHDFNYGYEQLLNIEKLLDFPILSANVRKEDGSRLLTPYVIKEVDGVSLGIFGLSTPETHYKTHPNNVAGLTFTDPAAEAKLMVEELQAQNVDAIIAVTHLGTDASSTDTSIKVAKEAQGIDLIVDGHSHTVDNLDTEAGTLIVSAGEYTKNLGVVELQFDEENTLVTKTASRMTKEDAADVVPDPEVVAIIENIKAEQELILNEVIGTSAVTLDGEREQVRNGETNLGNLATDAMIRVSGADVAITNGGGIRASIPAGDITKGNIITVFPFGNYVVTKQVTGEHMKAALENGVTDYPELKGAFPHVSGMTFEIDPSQPAGDRVSKVMINGEALDMSKNYVLATNDFMAAGGDEYTMFAEAPIVNEYPALDEVLIDYIQSMGEVNPTVDGRFSVAEESQAPTKDSVYIVQPGDTLYHIGLRYETTWRELQVINNLHSPHLIFPGQEIMLYKLN
ncbi:choice-of-anchor I family protein [Longirhabdus pacifica]|uniref:choice-of-anchor I family protein n=1 Tax=Longirhabdus pacifica TaxID=2305227 RepID=UPI0013E8B4D5|nr:choice-of-anchor I family protein [Longirhabdus pacifica]